MQKKITDFYKPNQKVIKMKKDRKPKEKLKNKKIRIFNKIKKKYSQYASWAIWDEKNYSNTDIIKPEKISLKYIFVALNVSRPIQGPAFSNFHSSFRGNKTKPYRIINNSKFYGSYMTDIFKDLVEVNSNNVKKWMKDNKEEVNNQINNFKNEIKMLEIKKPILIAFGNLVYKILNDNLKNEYKIYKVSHYAHFMKEEKYKNEINKLSEEI